MAQKRGTVKKTHMYIQKKTETEEATETEKVKRDRK